jgi:SAM-dependent methyltransferase
MSQVRQSRFFEPLLMRYARVPSIALCRVPELELLSALRLEGAVLDHCCGDGQIAALAFPGRQLAAGFDLDAPRLAAARARGNYARVELADAAARLPFDDGSFDAVINNSALEHIPELDRTLEQVARVLRRGGRLHFNVLNTRFYDWWPLDAASRADYRKFQPFYHAFDEAGWTGILGRHGFSDVEFRDYFPRSSAEVLADFDYRYSAFYLRHRVSCGPIATLLTPPPLARRRWRRLFGGLEWNAAPGQGAGFLVSAVRAA